MGNIFPNIRPQGLSQKDEVDFLYMCFAALQALCTKLDADGGPATTYDATVMAKVNLTITDSKGNRFSKSNTENSSQIGPHIVISPTGISTEARVWAGYYFWLAWETLCEALDSDSLTFSNYEAYAFTAVCQHVWKNSKGNTSGRGTDFYFGPHASGDLKHYIDDLYDRARAFYVLCHNSTTYGLDGDGTVVGTNYESLIYTAYFTLMIENSKGSQAGVSR